MNDDFVVDKKLCCVALQHRMEAAGERGIAALVAKLSDELHFHLQSRGVDFVDVPKLRAVPGSDIHINISEECILHYCPFCGRRLQELIDASRPAFEELARMHKKFLSVDI